MKVLYIFLDGTRSPGVIKKVRNKIRFLNELGMETTGIFLNTQITSYEFENAARIAYVPLEKPQLSGIFNRRFIRNWKWFFSYHRFNRVRYRLLEQEIAKYPFDIILMRYPLSNKHLFRFVKKHAGKVVFEHNSKEVTEMELNESGSPASRYVISQERDYGPKVLQRAKGIVGVGAEVTAYELSRIAPLNLPSAVIPNGIDVASVPLRNPPGDAAKELRLLYVTGSPSPWVGIDIVLRSMRRYAGDRKIILFVAGPVDQRHQDLARELGVESRVHFTGEKKGADLDQLFDQCHIAVGTMAMQRVGLNEHSSLKVVEYASRGIPFVLSYKDTNFHRTEAFFPYFRELPYNGKDVEMEEVVKFADKVMSDKDHPEKMRELAQVHLDFSVQMKKLKDFLKQFGYE